MKILRLLAVLFTATLLLLGSTVNVSAQKSLSADDVHGILDIFQAIEKSAFYKLTPEEVREIRECMLQRAFQGFRIPKGTTLQEDFVVESCFKQDRYARYQTPQQYQESQRESRGEAFYGIGVKISSDTQGIRIVEVTSGGPAETAGVLKPGDVVVAVGEDKESLQPLAGLSLQKASELIRGKEGTTVFLEMIREGKKMPIVQIKRGAVKERHAEGRIVEPGIGYLRISHFLVFDLIQEVLPILKEFEKQGVRALIIDLRRNPGGYSNAAEDFLGLFSQEEGMFITAYRNREGKQIDKPQVTKGRGEFADWALAVLVDQNSASASEIVAGVLQLWGAMVFGTQTYGKGSAQDARAVSDGGAFNFTIAHYFFENNESPEGVGITPDVEVKESGPESSLEVLKAAIEYLREELADNK